MRETVRDAELSESVRIGEPSAVRVASLWKRYKSVEAVCGIDFNVRTGEIFGLIGPDGAGKTSTLQMLAGVMEATSGQIEILGLTAREARAYTGYLTQSFSLYPDLTVMENLRYVGDLRRVKPRDVGLRGRQYLRMFDMDRFENRLAGQLSGGMKQKLALACALVPQPRVLLLDEPTTGVDPVSRREFWDTLAHLSADGLTILIATPYLDEAERCHRVALMHKGEIRKLGKPAELRASLGAKRLEVHTTDLARAGQVLAEIRSRDSRIIDVQRFGDRLDVIARDQEKMETLLTGRLRVAGLEPGDIRVDEPTLENTFVADLRGLGYEPKETAFPSAHDRRELRGQTAIGAANLTKHFGSFMAVKNVNLKVRYGEVYGLLGANGAGKTTTIKMLCGLLEPSAGEMLLAGASSDLRSQAIRRQIGYMSQRFSLYNDLTIEENLNFFAGVYGVPENERSEKVKWVLAFSGLEGKQDQITGSLPGGWKQRVAFGAAIMHEPKVIFLDEPTSGVDPLARRSFWTMINRLADSGAAILVTTHYLEESEQCNRLGLMVAGELVAEGSPSGIKSQQKGHLLEFVVDQPQRAADLLRRGEERWRVSLFGDRLHIVTENDAETAVRDNSARLEREGIRVVSAREGRFSLEDVFIGLVEKARQQGKIAAGE